MSSSRSIASLVRPNVRKLHPFSSARAEYTGVADILLDANENPFESDCNRYPDPYHSALRNKLAIWRGVPPDSILLGNGSDELIDLLVRTFCRPGVDVMRFIDPSFGMYEVVADINDVAKEGIPLTAEFELDVRACLQGQSDCYKILFLCSPNNPTGNDLSAALMKEVIQGWCGIVVVDEAYIDFSDQESLVGLIGQYPHLVVLQTFSKALGAAGLRVGMAYGAEEVIGYMNKIKPPYNLGTLIQDRAALLMDDFQGIAAQISMIKQERLILHSFLSKWSLVDHVFPSSANFLLIRCKDHNQLMQYLLEQKIVVRDRSAQRGCRGCLRITIGTPSENARLIEVCKNFKA